MKEEYGKLDVNDDGTISERETEIKKRLMEMENNDKKQDQQRKMAAIAMFCMIALTVFLLFPVLTPDKITALADIFTMFYIANAGIVAAFFGANAYMNVNR